MKRRQPIVLEFFGPPGVGKSTVAREVDAALRNQGVPTSNKVYDNSRIEGAVPRNLDKFKYIFRSTVPNPSELADRYRLLDQSDQSERGRFWNLFLYSCFLHGVKETIRGSDAVHILDQGALQLAWAIQYSGENDVHPADLLETYPSFENHVVVFVTADEETLYDRLRNRDAGRSTVEDESFTASTVGAIQTEMRDLFEYVDSRDDFVGVQSANDGTVAETTESVLDSLHRNPSIEL